MATAGPDEPHSVRIERRGGIAGLKPVVEREVAALSPAERQALDTVRRAPAAAPPAAPTRGIPAPADLFSYRVTITDGHGGTTTRDIGERKMPEALQRLCRPTP